MKELDYVLEELNRLANPVHFEKLKRFGINQNNSLGIKIPDLRQLAKTIGKNHELAIQLWDTGIHEAQILASYIDDPKIMTREQVEKWVTSFDSWDVCDQTCSIIYKTHYVNDLIDEYSIREEEFVKRTAFVLICAKAVHDKKATNDEFTKYFQLIEREADDERNFVRKAVNWALRQIGKRNYFLNEQAIDFALKLKENDSKSARWIATDALRELTSENIQSRLKNK